LPPLLDQIANPGNLDSIWKFFRKHHQTPTVDTAFRLVGKAVAFPATWITGHDAVNTSAFVPVASGFFVPVGLLLLVAGAVVAARRRDRDALALVVLTVAALGAGVYSVSHVVGPLAAYLVRWLLALGMVCWLAAAWTLFQALERVARGPTVRRGIATLAAVVLVAMSAVMVRDAARAHAPGARVGDVEARLARDTIANFRGDGRPVLLESTDDSWFEWGLAPRLEAAGISVASTPHDVLHFGRHRVALLHEARLAIVVVVG